MFGRDTERMQPIAANASIVLPLGAAALAGTTFLSIASVSLPLWALSMFAIIRSTQFRIATSRLSSSRLFGDDTYFSYVGRIDHLDEPTRRLYRYRRPLLHWLFHHAAEEEP